LQESEELPVDFTTLFDNSLFKFDTHLIPEVVALYKTMGVKHESLSLIPPQFEVPLPPLQPAVFMPQMRELAPPALDLFDLDDHFASEKLRLAQLTNKCTDADLHYFVKEAGEILGIADAVCEFYKDKDDKEPRPYSEITSVQVLHYIFKKVVNYKKVDQDPALKSVAPLLSNSAKLDAERVNILPVNVMPTPTTTIAKQPAPAEKADGADSKRASREGKRGPGPLVPVATRGGSAGKDKTGLEGKTDGSAAATASSGTTATGKDKEPTKSDGRDGKHGRPRLPAVTDNTGASTLPADDKKDDKRPMATPAATSGPASKKADS